MQVMLHILWVQQQILVYTKCSVYWYHVEDTAFGFSDSDDILLASCDVYSPDSNRRLCWHLLGDEIGGCRAGDNLDLNDDNDIVKEY